MINLLKKTPAALLGFFTLDDWRIQNMERDRAILNEQNPKIEDLIRANYEKETTNSTLLTKYEAISGRFKESQDEIKTLEDKYILLSERFSKSNLNHHEKTELISDMKYNLDRKMEVSKKITSEFNDITKDISHNDIFGFVHEYIDAYKEYLSNLNAEELACLSNALAFFIILSSLNSLIIVYYGNLIISYFNLEKRYPKLTNIIRIKSMMADKLIKFQISYIYVASLTMLFVNLYMF